MTQQAQVQLLDVAAVWDGEYDHFAWVKIAMEVSSTPNTVLPLLRWEDPLVDSVRLTEMMFLESMTPRHRRHSSDLSGETLADDDDDAMIPSPPAAHHQAPLTVVKHRRRHHQTMEPASPPSPLGAPSPPSGDDPSTNGADHHTAMMWKILQRPAFKPVDPTVVYEDGMMSLSFPRNVIQGALHIELTATIAMSETPTPGWLFFQLPGLALQNSCTGHFTFTLDTPGAHQTPKVVFDTDSLDADCITTPGSIAGPFSPRVPLAIALSLEKEEVRYLRDYELTTELHATFSWSEERGLRVEYNALVLPEILDGDEIFADKVSFEFWIRDGLKGRVGDVLGEGNGHVVVLNEMREGAAIEEMDEDGDEGEDKGEETKITVSCAPEDLRKPINVLWAQELGNGERFDVVLPTFQTDEGSVFGKGMVVCNVEHATLMGHRGEVMGFEHTFSHRREVRLPPLGDDDRLVMMIAPPPQPPPSPPPPHNDDGEIATPHHVTTMNFFGFLFWMLFGVLQYSLDAVRSVLGSRGMKRCVGVSLLLLLGRVVVGVAERGAISALERVDWGSPPCAEGVPMMTATTATATTTTRVVEVEVPWGTPESVVEKKEEVNWWDMTTLDKIDTALGWRPPV